VLPRHEVVRLLKRGRLLAALGLVWGFFRALRSARYQVAIDPQSNLRSSVVAWLSGAKRRIGFGRRFSKERSYLLRTDRVDPGPGPLLKVERNLARLEPLGVPAAGAPATLPIPEALLERARAWVREASGEGSSPEKGPGDEAARGTRPGLVAFHPGVSAFGQIKAWAPERYAELAKAAHDALGVRAVITWGPGERALAERVVEAAGEAALLGPETGSLLELAALYRALAAVVGSDTGPIHLAAAIGVPVVALYGPKDPAIYGPWSPGGAARVRCVWAAVHCSPCRLRHCPDVICMPAIEVAAVLAALEELLGGGQTSVAAEAGVEQPAARYSPRQSTTTTSNGS